MFLSIKNNNAKFKMEFKSVRQHCNSTFWGTIPHGGQKVATHFKGCLTERRDVTLFKHACVWVFVCESETKCYRNGECVCVWEAVLKLGCPVMVIKVSCVVFNGVPGHSAACFLPAHSSECHACPSMAQRNTAEHCLLTCVAAAKKSEERLTSLWTPNTSPKQSL